MRFSLIAQSAWSFLGDSMDCSTVSIAEIEVTNNNDLKIYPNPSSGVFNLKLNNQDFNTKQQMFIYNLNGKLVKQVSVSNNNTQIDLSDFDNGVYVAQIGSQSIKLVVVK